MLSVGFIYEPLVYVNPLQQGKTTPMLASSFKWGDGNKTLTFTIRSGVKWSDGTPMTANDVAYTFNLTKKYTALDLTGAWSALSSVTASGDTVTMNFSKVAVPYFYYIADQVPIVPEHVFSKMSNPVTDPVKAPVGTGPYTMSKCTPQNITYKANPNYWQPGLPKVKTIQYPAYTSNNTANDDLANGSAQWGGQYIPGIKAFYTAKSPDFKYWFPPTVNVTLIPNLTDPQLKNLKVRQAISYAINRTQVSNTGESGYEPPANQTGIVTPTFSSSLNQSALSGWGNGYDPAKAKSLLAQAGYHMSGGVMTNAAGQKLAFTVNNIGDYSDWVASMQVIQQNLNAVGIKLTPHNLSNPDHRQRPELREVPARLLRPADVRPERILRAEQLAQLGEHRAGRQAGRHQLRALQQQDHRQPARPVRDHHERVRAAEHPEQDPGSHGQRRADHPGDRGGGLVPVRHRYLQRLAHPGQLVRPAVAVRLPGQRAGAAAPGAEVTQTPRAGVLRQEPRSADPSPPSLEPN